MFEMMSSMEPGKTSQMMFQMCKNMMNNMITMMELMKKEKE